MRFVDEYRSPAIARGLAAEIAELAGDRPHKIMEICGGHTHAIYRHGIPDHLPDGVELVHGPGCPVCVVPAGRIDDAIALAFEPGVILTTFGDLMRVPGGQGSGSFLDANARGADIRMVYSPLDALKVARRNPDRRVVFAAIGFETTAPATAATVQRAAREGLDNFLVLSNHVLVEPAIRAILDAPGQDLDGFLGPGHVSTVLGAQAYEFVAREYGKPLVVSGFEPLDVLQAIAWVLRQRREGRAEVTNQYTRVVPWEGNAAAQRIIEATFTPRPTFEWRGLGEIPWSALALREEYAAHDAERHFALPGKRVADHRACQCAEVLTGRLKPWQCAVFGTACTPESPLGTCMVSSEGACAAYYHYGRLQLGREREVSQA